MTEGFFTDLQTACVFFRFCRRYKIESEQARRQVMGQLLKRKRVHYFRDVRPLLNGKKVLIVKQKPHNDGPEHYCQECK